MSVPLFSPHPELANILQRYPIWRGNAFLPLQQNIVSSGSEELDSSLGGGWVGGCLHELLPACFGIGEWSLLASTLRTVSAQGDWIALLLPAEKKYVNYVPYAPALAALGLDLQQFLVIHAKQQDLLWCYEQILASGAFMASVAWCAQADARALRRLQVAHQNQPGLAFVIRDLHAAVHTSPAPVRIKLLPAASSFYNLEAHVFKRRGLPLLQPVVIPVAPIEKKPVNSIVHFLAKQNHATTTVDCPVFPFLAD